MEKVTYKINDIVLFEPHEWKQVSLNPVIYEALKDRIIFKFQDYEKTEDSEIHSFHKKIFNKGEQIEVSIDVDKFKLSFDDHMGRTGETSDYDMEI